MSELVFKALDDYDQAVGASMTPQIVKVGGVGVGVDVGVDSSCTSGLAVSLRLVGSLNNPDTALANPVLQSTTILSQRIPPPTPPPPGGAAGLAGGHPPRPPPGSRAGGGWVGAADCI